MRAATSQQTQLVASTNAGQADPRGWKARLTRLAGKFATKTFLHCLPFYPSASSLKPSSSSSTTILSTATSASTVETPEDKKAWWGPISDIDPVRICRLVKRLVGDQHGDHCWLHEKHAGGYNQVYIVMFDDGADGIKVVLKVPAAGWAPRWCEQDAIYLRSEALTLRYIHQQCDDVPFVPRTLAYDTTFDNEIGAPYLLMTHLKGRPASEIWGFVDEEGKYDLPEHPETRRTNLHMSLARAMWKLKHVEFDGIGLPDYVDDECNGPFIRTEFLSDVVDMPKEEDGGEIKADRMRYVNREWTEIPTFASTESFFWYWIGRGTSRFERYGAEQSLSLENVGHVQFMSLLPGQIPGSRLDFAKDSAETFSLSHKDLDFQNVLCDDDGNVTGIIDWEGVCSRPASLAWAALPLWLRQDWDNDNNWPWNSLDWTLPQNEMLHYRQQYSEKLNELESRPESHQGPDHPAISHLTCSLYETCRDRDGDLSLWCDRLLQLMVPTFRIDFFVNLGRHGWTFLPSDPDDDPTKLDDWLKEWHLFYHLNYGCSSAEWKLIQATKSAKARDPDRNIVCSSSNVSSEDADSIDARSSLDMNESRPSTPDTDVSLSPASSPAQWSLLPSLTESEDTHVEDVGLLDSQPGPPEVAHTANTAPTLTQISAPAEVVKEARSLPQAAVKTPMDTLPEINMPREQTLEKAFIPSISSTAQSSVAGFLLRSQFPPAVLSTSQAPPSPPPKVDLLASEHRATDSVKGNKFKSKLRRAPRQTMGCAKRETRLTNKPTEIEEERRTVVKEMNEREYGSTVGKYLIDGQEDLELDESVVRIKKKEDPVPEMSRKVERAYERCMAVGF
ncbi:hypothetical protein FKW77_001156 [Venturia effusa]|uniref:Uncharacterized protein n=1 Tax=Venturia effusa TaxID=50376 RepID=A0A517L4U6_9PEZI|nr:hypothetical protein FKW77_001156 [Venturia effusa]